LLGQRAAAARQIDASIASFEGGEQRCHLAEVLRLRGWLYGVEGDRANAERLLLRAMSIARTQEARSWELRAAMSLAEVLERDGEAARARELLQPACDWFTEGFNTSDLMEAQRILSRLLPSPVRHVAVPPDPQATGAFRTAS